MALFPMHHYGQTIFRTSVMHPAGSLGAALARARHVDSLLASKSGTSSAQQVAISHARMRICRKISARMLSATGICRGGPASGSCGALPPPVACSGTDISSSRYSGNSRTMDVTACSASSMVEAGTEESVELRQPQKPATARRKRVLSGVQPTGVLHLGNYLGAIKNWVSLQDLYDTFFCVVDMHAITLPHDPKELQEATRRSAALYIAAGIDPARASIFVQSHVPAHAELSWLLMCYTPIGWLRRMIQFKEKAAKAGLEEVGAGLLTYPVLMASDILLYQADLVPVGEDQKQHIELARDIAERFNSKFGGSKWKKLGGRGGKIFKVPDIFIPPAGARVMSLTDGTSKMSKSAESDMSRINLLDSPDTIALKIKRAKTDAFEGLEADNPDRPEARNLLTIYALVTGQSMETALEEVGSMSWGQFKGVLADAVVAHLEPLQDAYKLVVADPTYLDEVLADGAAKANEAANWTLNNCRQAMGFVPATPRKT